MLANSILMQCVNRCLLGCTHAGSSILNCNISRQEPTKHDRLKTLLWLISKTPDQSNIESFYTTGTQQKIDCSSVDGFCGHCYTIFEALGCFYHFCECQEVQPCLTDEDIDRGQKKREMDELRRSYLREKNYSIIEMWECEWKQKLRENDDIKSFVWSSFPFKRPLSVKNLLHRIRNGKLFGYVQCDINVPDSSKEKFATFPPFFKSTLVSRSDIGEFMKQYAEENKLLTQPRRMLISSYHLTIVTIIAPLFIFI